MCEAVARAPRRLVQRPRGKAVPGGRWSGLARAPPPQASGAEAREDGASAVQQRGGAGSPRPSAAAPARPLSFLPRGGTSARSLPLCAAGAEGPPCPPVRECARTSVPAGWASSKLGPQRRSWHGSPPNARSRRRRCGWGESPARLLSSLLIILRPEDFGFCPLPLSIPPPPGDVEGWGG